MQHSTSVASRTRKLSKRLQGRQEVAAVCYRITLQGIQFLLVRTGGRRWTFPKGGVKTGFSYARSAALEAFEEAGVHGRIEEMPFARYQNSKGPGKTKSARELARTEPPVIAHLCEVASLEAPQEVEREPTWFSPEETKRRLSKDRPGGLGGNMAAVVDRAVARITRTRSTSFKADDGLRRNRFDAQEDKNLGARESALIRYFSMERRSVISSDGTQVEGNQRIRAGVRRLIAIDRTQRSGETNQTFDAANQPADLGAVITTITGDPITAKRLSLPPRKQLGSGK